MEESTEFMRGYLTALGFTIGKRDPRVNTAYSGQFMVIEIHEESELPTKDGSNGPWAVVGDDLGVLIKTAYNFVTSL